MKSNRPTSGYTRDREVALEILNSSLVELRQSLLGIEGGNNIACRTAATIINRILVDELPLASRGYKVRMRSYLRSKHPERDPFPLTTLEVTKSGTRIAPIIQHKTIYEVIPLQNWKTQKSFYGKEASAMFQGRINEPLLEDLSREKIVRDTRNEMGAHVDRDISNFSHLSMQYFTRLELRVVDGEPLPETATMIKPHKWNYISATIASISFEILKSIRVIPHEGKHLFFNNPETAP